LYLVCDIINLNLQILLLHLEYLPLVFELADLSLLLENVNLLLLQKVVQGLRALLIVQLLLLQLTQLVGKLFKLIVSAGFLLLKFSLQTLYLIVVLK